jgi:acyl-CoA synthetase (AMP-forming)/AMP-acid ligase II
MHIPISHFGSVGNVLLSTLVAGGTVCVLERFTPRSTLELIERERVTVWGQVPTMFL